MEWTCSNCPYVCECEGRCGDSIIDDISAEDVREWRNSAAGIDNN